MGHIKLPPDGGGLPATQASHCGHVERRLADPVALTWRPGAIGIRASSHVNAPGAVRGVVVPDLYRDGSAHVVTLDENGGGVH